LSRRDKGVREIGTLYKHITWAAWAYDTNTSNCFRMSPPTLNVLP